MTSEESMVNVNQVLQLTHLDINETDINWSKVKLNGFRWLAVRHNSAAGVGDGTSESSVPSTPTTSVANSLPSEAYYPHLFNAAYRNHSCDDLRQYNHSNNGSNDERHTNGAAGGGVAGSGRRETMETLITCVNPFTHQLYNCQTSCDTKCAQISADNDMIAISNDRFVAVYSVQTNQCLNTLAFSSGCRHWQWISPHLIAIVTDREVFHWNIDSPFKPEMKFKLEKRLQDYQITGYKCDTTCDLWFAITSLYVDDEGEVNGCVQIHSKRDQLSQCIDSHALQLCQYKFAANEKPTEVLLSAKRHQMNAIKIYIIELGPIIECNNSLISRTEVIPQLDTEQTALTPDFPVSIECNAELGLIYVFSKYGALYVCDIETGALMTTAFISEAAVFATAYDSESQTLLAVNRCGQLLAIELYLTSFVRHLNSISKQEIAQRIQASIGDDNQSIGKCSDEDDDDCDEITRL